MTNEEKALLAGAKDSTDAAGVYADWLEDHDRPIEAARWREKAGLSRLRYYARHKLTKNCVGKEYKTLGAARASLERLCKPQKSWVYKTTGPGELISRPPLRKYSEFEIVVRELCVREIGTLPAEPGGAKE